MYLKSIFDERRVMKNIISSIFILILLLSSVLAQTSRLDKTIDKASSLILNELREGEYFNMPSFLGTPYSVQYMLYTKYSNKPELFPEDWQAVLKRKIINERQADGSWRYLRNENISKGELGATIINYWGLKVLGEDLNSPIMKASRDFIISEGGLEKAPVFLQIFLAIFNNFQYEDLPLPPIPDMLFSKSSLVPSGLKVKQFGQWVAPHLLPIIYLTRFEIKKELNMEFRLDELYAKKIPSRKLAKPFKKRVRRANGYITKTVKTKMQRTSKFLIDELLISQKKAGSYGGYTLATFLSNIVFEHHLNFVQDQEKSDLIRLKIKKGDEFLTLQHYDKQKEKHIFDGWTCDGRIWDTSLLTQSLFEAGVDKNILKKPIDFVLSFQTPEGGFPFGLDFESYPDHDDAAEVLLLLNHADKNFPNTYVKEITKLENWLLSRQNKDGGWGAFDVDNNGNALIKFLGGNLLDSVDLFDESSSDVTAHVVEALASRGYNIENSTHIQKAYQYFLKSKKSNGLWMGRWGINYIYGTSAVVTALAHAGVKLEDEILKAPVEWLVNTQNNDGGYGESSDSYSQISLAGKGKSTVTQTAWVLTALTSFYGQGQDIDDAINTSSDYLIDFMEVNNKWFDTSVVGTGHPGIIYMDYPSYAFAFPLIALSNLRKVKKGVEHE